MEVRTLRYFLAVAREGSITRAANFLHLTQPTLSRQMQDLEQELGRQLLVRKSHRVDLTPEGVLLRKRAEEIVAMVDKTEAEFIALEDTVSGDIYIGSGETRALCPIAGLMRRDSPLAQKERIERADLMGLPLICSRQAIAPHPGENAFADWFGTDFSKLDIAVNYNLVYNAALLVEAGVGYAITLDGLTNTSETSSLCFKPLWPRLESGLDIVWKKYQVFSPAAELFLSRLREMIRRHSEA